MHNRQGYLNAATQYEARGETAAAVSIYEDGWIAAIRADNKDFAVILTYRIAQIHEKAESWDAPGASNWIRAEEAHFVIGADVKGGMGAPEIVPFGDKAAASDFTALKGGTIAKLDDIPGDAVLSAVDLPLPEEVKP